MMSLPAFRNLPLDAACPARLSESLPNREFAVAYVSPSLLSILLSGLLIPVRLVPLLLIFYRFCLIAPAPTAARGSIPATRPDAVPLICMFAG